MLIFADNIKNSSDMDIQQIISQLQDKFGNSFDVAKVTNLLKGLDLSKISFNEIVSKLTAGGLLGDLNGKQEGLVDELKGKAGDMLGGLGKMFGK